MHEKSFKWQTDIAKSFAILRSILWLEAAPKLMNPLIIYVRRFFICYVLHCLALLISRFYTDICLPTLFLRLKPYEIGLGHFFIVLISKKFLYHYLFLFAFYLWWDTYFHIFDDQILWYCILWFLSLLK